MVRLAEIDGKKILGGFTRKELFGRLDQPSPDYGLKVDARLIDTHWFQSTLNVGAPNYG
jgi:hypothetical protein